MKNRLALITAAVALAGAASSAFAIEDTQQFTNATALSTKSRAEVIAELNAARADGSLASWGEASAGPVAASTVSRAEVVAELRAAQRDGTLVDFNEGSPAPVAQAMPRRMPSTLAATGSRDAAGGE